MTRRSLKFQFAPCKMQYIDVPKHKSLKNNNIRSVF